MNSSFHAQREALRLRLQEQRQLFGRQVSTAVYNNEQYPRSLTMSLLSRRSSLTMWAVTELLPLLLLRFLGNSGNGLINALQTYGAFKRAWDDPDVYPLRNR